MAICQSYIVTLSPVDLVPLLIVEYDCDIRETLALYTLVLLEYDHILLYKYIYIYIYKCPVHLIDYVQCTLSVCT